MHDDSLPDNVLAFRRSTTIVLDTDLAVTPPPPPPVTPVRRPMLPPPANPPPPPPPMALRTPWPGALPPGETSRGNFEDILGIRLPSRESLLGDGAHPATARAIHLLRAAGHQVLTGTDARVAGHLWWAVATDSLRGVARGEPYGLLESIILAETSKVLRVASSAVLYEYVWTHVKLVLDDVVGIMMPEEHRRRLNAASLKLLQRLVIPSYKKAAR